MNIQDIDRKRLESELRDNGLQLTWFPDPQQLRAGNLIVFGAEQQLDAGKPLIAGFGPGGRSEAYGNSPSSVVEGYGEKFLVALETVGIPRAALHQNYIHVGRGKIWPTFVASLTQDGFASLPVVTG